jgi:hypothetical protein
VNASERAEVLPEPGPVEGARGHPGVDAMPLGPYSGEQTPPRNPVTSSVPNGGDFEAFVGGAGI